MSRDEPAAAWLAGLAREAARPAGQAFAAANIALSKYWGKRDEALNLPVTSSLSVSLGELGTRTVVTVGEHADAIRLNGEDVPPEAGFTLLVDGHFKNQFETLSQAKQAATELKSRFPMLRIAVYDAANKARLPV